MGACGSKYMLVFFNLSLTAPTQEVTVEELIEEKEATVQLGTPAPTPLGEQPHLHIPKLSFLIQPRTSL